MRPRAAASEAASVTPDAAPEAAGGAANRSLRSRRCDASHRASKLAMRPRIRPPKRREIKISYEGIWTTADAQGQTFDIVIFPNGQAVTNWAKGTEGARGERGYWRQDQQRLTAAYSDGSTDIIAPDGNRFRHQRFSAGSPLDSEPTAQTEAERAEGSQFALVGVWRLNKEPDGSHLYIALQSNGRAISTINGGYRGEMDSQRKRRPL